MHFRSLLRSSCLIYSILLCLRPIVCPTITYELQADPYRSGEAITTQEWHDLLKTQDFGQVVERDEFPPGRDVIQIRQPNRNSPPAQIISLHPDSSRKLDQQQQDPLTNPAKTSSSTAPSDSGRKTFLKKAFSRLGFSGSTRPTTPTKDVEQNRR
ncbi:hypothetical protein PGT21_008837 [Puccinia graminis f. sp. tritici]|uniref:Uncharacterized protein n=1 Tax=Puccinia graminis f. sp. tritici TaxID=56615 RepID=A0A5B0LM64_PUCGR|nr:hypothetical protein PGT21_008837 [Puccinia graminis f. sp. tritici]